MNPLRVVVATGNPGKAREFGRLLGDGFVVEHLPATISLPEETGTTFAENALLKAAVVAEALGGNAAVLADDSGLMVDTLGGRPGVQSARYAGEGAGDDANNRKLLAELAGTSEKRAHFVCALALVLPDGTLVTAEGGLPGRIVAEPRGTRGFGYDPVFQPDGWTITVAEMEDGQKDAVSHRARAVEALRRQLSDRGLAE